MNNQKILDKAPEGSYTIIAQSAIDACKMSDLSELLRAVNPRSLLDVKRIVELEEKLWRTKQESEQAVNRAAEMIEHRDERITELEDLAQMIIDAESADLQVLSLMYQAWLHKAKALKEQGND